MAGVWTGKELAVINTQPQPGLAWSVSAYDPVLDRWRDIPTPSNVTFASRIEPFLGAVAGKLIVYGGIGESPAATEGVLTDGWVIDLTDLTWTAMTPGPPLWPPGEGVRLPRVFADGPRALFVPATDTSDGTTDVAVATYDLSTQTWETAPTPSTANGFGCDGPGWNGSQAVCASVYYLYRITSHPLAVEAFPTLDESLLSYWNVLSPVGGLFFGVGFPLNSSVPDANQVFWVDPSRETWSAPTQLPAPLGSAVATVNGQILIWGGTGPATIDPGGRVSETFVGELFDPVAGVWSAVTCVDAPSWAAVGVTVATPTGLIVFNGADDPTAAAVLEL